MRYPLEGIRQVLPLICLVLFLARNAGAQPTVAGQIQELGRQAERIKELYAQRHVLVEQESEIVRSMTVTTDIARERVLRGQHQQVLREIGRNDATRLGLIREAVELLQRYDPGKLDETEAALRYAKFFIDTLKRERDMILGDPDAPDVLVAETGIDRQLEVLVAKFRLLSDQRQRLTVKREGQRIEEEPARPMDGTFITWFERQDPTVKAALITAIIGGLFAIVTTLIMVLIKQRS